MNIERLILISLKGLVFAVVGAVATSAFTFFKNDIAVYTASRITKGELNGEWDVETLAYPEDNPTPKLSAFHESLSLRQFGFRVVGTVKTTDAVWDVAGYYNNPNLALSYVTTLQGGAGLGSYTLRAAATGSFAFVGYYLGVECKGEQKVLLKCPCVVVRSSHRELKGRYQSHLRADHCEEISESYLDGFRASAGHVVPATFLTMSPGAVFEPFLRAFPSSNHPPCPYALQRMRQKS